MYDGCIWDGKPSEGEYQFENGRKWIGEFEEGIPDGKGKYIDEYGFQEKVDLFDPKWFSSEHNNIIIDKEQMKKELK